MKRKVKTYTIKQMLKDLKTLNACPEGVARFKERRGSVPERLRWYLKMSDAWGRFADSPVCSDLEWLRYTLTSRYSAWPRSIDYGSRAIQRALKRLRKAMIAADRFGSFDCREIYGEPRSMGYCL
jgi:hypothetical protein